MKITINIDDRTGNAIKEFCRTNNVRQNEYLIGIIEKQFNIDRFGDMNEMVKPKKQNNVMKKIEMTEVKKQYSEDGNTQTVISTEATNSSGKITKRVLKTK